MKRVLLLGRHVYTVCAEGLKNQEFRDYVILKISLCIVFVYKVQKLGRKVMQGESGFQKNVHANLFLLHPVKGCANKGKTGITYVNNFLQEQSQGGVL